MEDELLALELEVARSICPDFDPSRSDAWRQLIEGMIADKAIANRLRQINRTPKTRGAKKKAREVWVTEEFHIYRDEDPRRRGKTRKALLQGFQQWLARRHKWAAERSPGTLGNLITKGERSLLLEPWQGRAFLEQCRLAALEAARISTFTTKNRHRN